MRAVALDVETGSKSGKCSGLDYWHPDFKVTDLALSWRDDDGKMISHHVEGMEEIGDTVRRLLEKDVLLIVHNAQFDLGVLQSCYGIKVTNYFCTQRLCQVGDAGQIQKMYRTRQGIQGGIPMEGLSLVACCSRWLNRKYHNHKDEAHNWIKKNIGEKVNPGEYLWSLPTDIMKRYNCADTENTLRLYEEVTEQFAKDRYTGWELDHQLYRGRVEQLINSFVGGVKVDPTQNQTCIDDTQSALDMIWEKFYEIHKDDILKCIAIKIKAYCDDPTLKSDKAREARWYKVAMGLPFGDRDKICGFNVNGNDLLMLYRDVLGISVPFTTLPNKKTGSVGGKPSFKKAHLPAWHKESGKILSNKGTLGIVKKQAESLQKLSGYDGRYHLSMRSTGTKTGRLSGGTGE